MSHEIQYIPRSVITGIKDGKSTILQDSLANHVLKHESGFIISDIWATGSPINFDHSAKIEDSLFPVLQHNGSLFRYVVIPPDTEIIKHFEPKPDQPHPLMHQTQTLDYIVILSGEIYLIMDDTETLLKPGDIVIQKATNHAWSNRTNKPCIKIAILLDAPK